MNMVNGLRCRKGTAITEKNFGPVQILLGTKGIGTAPYANLGRSVHVGGVITIGSTLTVSLPEQMVIRYLASADAYSPM